MKILIETAVEASAAEAWRAWTTPADIVCWNTASPDWHTTSAELQRNGWQAILDNFARHVVAARRKS